VPPIFAEIGVLPDHLYELAGMDEPQIVGELHHPLQTSGSVTESTMHDSLSLVETPGKSYPHQIFLKKLPDYSSNCISIALLFCNRQLSIKND